MMTSFSFSFFLSLIINALSLFAGIGAFTIVDGHKVSGEDVGNKYDETRLCPLTVPCIDNLNTLIPENIACETDLVSLLALQLFSQQQQHWKSKCQMIGLKTKLISHLLEPNLIYQYLV